MHDESSSSSDSDTECLMCGLVPGEPSRSTPRRAASPAQPRPGDAKVGLLYDSCMELHDGPEHVERPARVIVLYAKLQEEGLLERCSRLVARPATDPELRLAHSAEHIKKVDGMFAAQYKHGKADLRDESYCFADGCGDLYLCAHTATAARYAAGCCIEGTLAVCRGSVQRSLAVVRPPGHHAECERAMGFCFFNNVAAAALTALQQPGIRRVAVLDWDVHHGNGIQNILYDRPDALYISIHRDPSNFYPYHSGFRDELGIGAGTGFNVNVPWLERGMRDADYKAAFALLIEPILAAYAPDLVLVAAGYDAAEGDPLGGCKVTPDGYAWMTERLLRHAGGRLVLALEGGYNTRMTSLCAAACLHTLLAGAAPPPAAATGPASPTVAAPGVGDVLPSTHCHDSLKLVYEAQAAHWEPLRGRTWAEAWDAYLQELNAILPASSGSGAQGPGAQGVSLQDAFAARRARAAAAARSAAAAAAGAAAILEVVRPAAVASVTVTEVTKDGPVEAGVQGRSSVGSGVGAQGRAAAVVGKGNGDAVARTGAEDEELTSPEWPATQV